MTALPDPMTPPDCDLRGLPFMPLDVNRLLDSDLFALSTGEEFKAALALWARSWNQIPAASLPNDERVLARLAAVSLADWRGLSALALRGWISCSDGRLYHPVVAEKALAAWLERIAHRKRSAVGNAKRWGSAFDPTPFETAANHARAMLNDIAPSVAAEYGPIPQGSKPHPSRTQTASLGDPSRIENRSEGTGTGIIPVGAANAAELESPDKEAWRRCVGLLVAAGRMKEARARSLFGKLLSEHKLEPRDLLASIVTAEGNGTPDPQAYLAKAARAIAERRNPGKAPANPSTWGDGQWAAAISMWRQDGSWSANLGPEPGQVGCRVPAHLMGIAA